MKHTILLLVVAATCAALQNGIRPQPDQGEAYMYGYVNMEAGAVVQTR